MKNIIRWEETNRKMEAGRRQEEERRKQDGGDGRKQGGASPTFKS